MQELLLKHKRWHGQYIPAAPVARSAHASPTSKTTLPKALESSRYKSSLHLELASTIDNGLILPRPPPIQLPMAHSNSNNQPQRTRIRIPFVPYRPTTGPNRNQPISHQPPMIVSFEYADGRMGAPGLGVWVRHLRGQGTNTPIAGMNDLVLSQFQEISLRINWPGYEQHTGRITLVNRAGERLTRVGLGMRIADHLVQYYYKVRDEQPTTLTYQLHPTGIRPEHMYLCQIVHAAGNVFQADVVVDGTPPPY
ncbi:hypothetical protein C8F01DRAFT_1310534 [Mycena amicta]|nr:hypothetical protein C8F01DRAFT_1310534 [Mycena amicta]